MGVNDLTLVKAVQIKQYVCDKGKSLLYILFTLNLFCN